MFFTILGGIALLAAVAAILVLTPAQPWRLDGETWYEQFAPRGRRDTFAEELTVMRVEAEAEAFAAARQPSRSRATAKLGDVAPGATRLGASNHSW